MNKKRNNELIRLAEERLRTSNLLNEYSIADTYDGKTAALSVSVAMLGLLPTLAVYYQDYDSNNPDAPCRRNVLNVVASMISTTPERSNTFADAEALLEYAINLNNNEDLIRLKKEVIDCAVALKQIVRTYNQV